jgi:putative transposase
VVVFYNVTTLLQLTYFVKAKKKLLPQGMGEASPLLRREQETRLGVGTATQAGTNLVEQVPTLSLESHGFM